MEYRNAALVMGIILVVVSVVILFVMAPTVVYAAGNAANASTDPGTKSLFNLAPIGIPVAGLLLLISLATGVIR